MSNLSDQQLNFVTRYITRVETGAAADAEATPAPAPASRPVSNVAFMKSRILWGDAKKKMSTELAKLRAAIVTQSADDEDNNEILAVADEMLAEFDQFDDRLEDVLDDITNTEEGSARTALRKRASAVVSDYMAMLDTPFFKSVDNNPFTSVAVTSTARQSLGTIQKTLV